MTDLEIIKKERARDLRQSLEFIDFYVDWIKKTPNKIWSQKQADLYKSVYDAINADWRKTIARSK